MSAYLVAHIDVKQSPPVVVRVSIKSCASRLLTRVGNGIEYADIYSIPGLWFEEGCQAIEEMIDRGEFAWVKPLFGGNHE